MATSIPEFLLFAGAEVNEETGRWHFSLESVGGHRKVTATEVEVDDSGSRLELLAVIRGLEALDQPSQVTLVTTSAYVRRGIRFGIEEWRNSSWRWERFGRMVPVNNADLWKRLDQALQFHQVKCRSWRFQRVDTRHVLRGPHRRRRTAAAAGDLPGAIQKQAS